MEILSTNGSKEINELIDRISILNLRQNLEEEGENNKKILKKPESSHYIKVKVKKENKFEILLNYANKISKDRKHLKSISKDLMIQAHRDSNLIDKFREDLNEKTNEFENLIVKKRQLRNVRSSLDLKYEKSSKLTNLIQTQKKNQSKINQDYKNSINVLQNSIKNLKSNFSDYLNKKREENLSWITKIDYLNQKIQQQNTTIKESNFELDKLKVDYNNQMLMSREKEQMMRLLREEMENKIKDHKILLDCYVNKSEEGGNFESIINESRMKIQIENQLKEEIKNIEKQNKEYTELIGRSIKKTDQNDERRRFSQTKKRKSASVIPMN